MPQEEGWGEVINLSDRVCSPALTRLAIRIDLTDRGSTQNRLSSRARNAF